MAVPKKKTSPRKRDQRRRSKRLAQPAVSTCPNCKSFKRPHAICAFCGHYAGRLVIH